MSSTTFADGHSGKISLTNYFKLLNYKIYIVNSDGLKYSENQWKFSETYNYLNQKKAIISDKHTRKYDVLDESEALILLTESPEFRSPDFNLIKSRLTTPIIFARLNKQPFNTYLGWVLLLLP